MKKILSLIIALVLLMSFTAINAKEVNVPDNNSLPKIVIAGTGDNQAVMRALAEAFTEKSGGNCLIEVPDSVGSTAGIKAVVAGKADLARVARPLKSNERGLNLTCKMFASTPVVFVVHPDVKDINNITTGQILGIYSGKITNWKELGAKPGKIYPLIREPGDSALTVLNKQLPGFADINSPTGKVMYLTPETVTALQEHKQTIGFLPMSATVNTNLRILKLNGIEPSNEKILSGEYNCLIPFSIVYKDSPSELAGKFIEFLYSEDARKIMEKMGTVPVNAE